MTPTRARRGSPAPTGRAHDSPLGLALGPRARQDGQVSAGAFDPPEVRRREQRGWYFYDWAASAFSTTVGTVFLGPYLTSIAESACRIWRQHANGGMKSICLWPWHFSLYERMRHISKKPNLSTDNVKIMDQDHDGRNPKKSIVTNCVDEELIGSTR